MEQQAIKEFLYGGLSSIIANRNYYYKGIGSEYSHFTEKGEEAVKEFMNLMAWKMMQANEADLDQRAKDLVLKELKS